MKCLVVVAHPDDEIVWMGGTIIRNSQWEWHVVSLCRRDDPDRAPRFRKAARALSTHACISDLDDGSPTLAPLSPDLREIKDRILSMLRGPNAPKPHAAQAMLRGPQDPKLVFDLIFTHGPSGEYTRHERHEQVHRAVREMIQSGELTGDLVCFAYEDRGGSCRPHPASDAEVLVELTPEEHAAKQRLVRDVYGFQPGSFEFDSAGATESFNRALERLEADCLRLQVGRALGG